MASTFTTNKNIEKPGHNDYVDDWDVPVNANMDVIDSSLGSVSIINLTGLASYTLTFTNLRASTIKFTGTLNSGVVTVLLTNGVSGSFNIINATAQTDSTSVLSLGWTSGGSSYTVAQNATRLMYADGGNLIWAPAAPNALQSVATIPLTGVTTNAYNLTSIQVSAGLINFSGTLGNSVTAIYQAPSGFTGVLQVACTYTTGGGTLGLSGSGGGATVTLSAGNGFTLAIIDSTHAYTLGSHAL